MQVQIPKEYQQYIKHYIDEGQIDSWEQMSQALFLKVGRSINSLKLKQKWDIMVQQHLIKKKSQWDPQQIEFMMTIFEKYGPQIQLIGETIWTKRSPIAIRNCLKNQLQKAVRFIQEIAEEHKVSFDPLENSDLLKLSAILINSNPEISKKATELRLKIINVWRQISSLDTKTSKEDVDHILNQIRNIKNSMLKPPVSRRKLPPRRTKAQIHQQKMKRQKQRQMKKKQAQQQRLRQKLQNEQKKHMKAQEIQKKKLKQEIQRRKQREKNISNLIQNLQDSANGIGFNNDNNIFNDD